MKTLMEENRGGDFAFHKAKSDDVAAAAAAAASAAEIETLKQQLASSMSKLTAKTDEMEDCKSILQTRVMGHARVFFFVSFAYTVYSIIKRINI